jgi:1-acyl-sn-glycerol-3-phosphate acyltransferase
MTLFPEGTRTRDGSIRKGRPGSGLVILATKPAVVPVTIEGRDRVLPIGAKRPKLFNKLYVYYGEPIDYSDLIDQPRTRETSDQLVDRIMEALRRQQAEIHELKGE